LIDKETIPEQALAPDSGREDLHELLALAVAWSSDEPWRVGQVVLLPPGDPGPVMVFGRGASSDTETKVGLVENRPGRTIPTPPLGTAAISRTQLELRAIGPDRIWARNVGKCPLLRNGVEVDHADFQLGELLQLGQQLLFVVTRRLAGWTPNGYPDFPSGQADSYGIVGESASVWRLRKQMVLAASQSGHLFISGQTGTGKELVAQATHALSPRGHRQLVARNASTLPDSLVDAELFGNCKNYPNPGMPDRPGLVGEAHGSTLFLDEIGDLALAAQAHLLRVLDRGEYSRLGEATARRSDFRLIGATNRPPGALKPDLLARFKLQITVPDLASRVEDIPLLVRYLIRRAVTRGDVSVRKCFPDGDTGGEPRLSLRRMHWLLEQRYDANVRELDSVLFHELTASERSTSVPPEPIARHSALSHATLSKGAHEASVMRANPLAPERIQQCLDQNNGILERTWRALGMKNRFELIRLIRKHQLHVRRRPGQGPLRIPKRSRQD
jgi:two-component system nitrogen regulation response regulator GlnG/two-component system response regulator HydG